MKQDHVLILEKQKLYDTAAQLVQKMGGLNHRNAGSRTLQERNDQVRAALEQRIDARVVYRYIPASEIHAHGREMTFGDITLRCNAFEQLHTAQIRGACVFFLYAGEYELEDQPATEQVLADLWGTAFTDAARQCFRDMLEEYVSNDGGKLSEAFGPGFYGMPVNQMKELACLADPTRIGLHVHENGLLVPLKACAGLYFFVSPDYLPLRPACQECIGTKGGCRYCNVCQNRNTPVFRCIGNCDQCSRCQKEENAVLQQAASGETFRFPPDFRPDETAGYAVAVDVGTTTMVGFLWDRRAGKQRSSAGKTNPQVKHGGDIISRLSYAKQSSHHKEELRDALRNGIQDIVRQLCRQERVSLHDVNRMVLCGNTVMSSFLTASSFDSGKSKKVMHGRAGDIGLLPSDAEVFLLPGIGGQVGGDITAGLLAERLPAHGERALFLDLGTNGEIVLCNRGSMIACSAAAGPALEGASIAQGMRAIPGAIEQIRIVDQEVRFVAIGGIPPVGICGSGIIDAAAELLRTGVMDYSGRLLSSKQYRSKHPDSLLADRIREGRHGREFVLVLREDAPDIVLTQRDIRSIQLAKGAIAAGEVLLMRHAGVHAAQLDRVILAGAFGNDIRRESAVAIGLIPALPLNRILPVGNSAGKGALMAAASEAEQRKTEEIARKTQHLELADQPLFQSLFLAGMSFSGPETFSRLGALC